MRSFRRKPSNKRSVYLQLVGSIESQLRQAFAKRNEEEGLTQKDIADKLGVNRSVVHRKLSGQSNLTAESIADLVWAMGHCIRVDIFDPKDFSTNEFHILPTATDLIETRSGRDVSGRGPTSASKPAQLTHFNRGNELADPGSSTGAKFASVRDKVDA